VSSVAPRAAGLPTQPVLAEIVREHAFRRLWISGFCLNTARWMDLVVLAWLAFQLTGSPFMVGLAAFARSAPMMLLGPWSGLVADRVSRGHVVLITQSLGFGTGLALCALFGSGRGAYWPLVGLEVVFGVAWALDFPARRTALYALVGPRRVAAAVSLETVSMQLAKIAGPVIAGIGLARLGPAPCFAAIALLYALGLSVSVGLAPRMGRGASPVSGSAIAKLVAGGRAAWHEPTVRAVLVITVFMNVLLFPYQSLLAVFAREVLDAGPAWLGALVAADGLGSLLGALAIASGRGFMPHRRIFAGAVIVAPVALGALAASRARWLSIAILLVMGLVESGFATMQSTLVLLSARDEQRGGAMGILSACIGTQPIGTLWLGFLATTIGIAPAMGVNSAAAGAAIAPIAIALWRRGGQAGTG